MDADLDLSGLETVNGGTFRWSGSYHGSMAEAETHETHLNVFEHFQPNVPSKWTSPIVTFCANLHPSIQGDVLDQAPPSRLSMLDSMNLWIQIALEDLISVMKRVDLVIINDGEVRMLAGDDNLVRAAHSVRSLIGATYLIVKRGEHGVLALHPEGTISIPAYPVADVVDPTGCGDAYRAGLIYGMIHAAKVLKKDGILVIVTFHSLEDKIVKYFFRSLSEHKSVSRYQPEEIHEEILFNLLQKKPIVPSSLELKENPPSRSAKLRCLIKKENFYDFKTDILDKFKDLIEIENLGLNL